MVLFFVATTVAKLTLSLCFDPSLRARTLLPTLLLTRSSPASALPLLIRRRSQAILESKDAEEREVREREARALAASVAAAEAERGRLTTELARRAQDLADARAAHAEREALLER